MALPVKAPPSLCEISSISVPLRKELQHAIIKATMRTNPQKYVDKLLPLLEAVTTNAETANSIFNQRFIDPMTEAEKGKKTIFPLQFILKFVFANGHLNYGFRNQGALRVMDVLLDNPYVNFEVLNDNAVPWYGNGGSFKELFESETWRSTLKDTDAWERIAKRFKERTSGIKGSLFETTKKPMHVKPPERRVEWSNLIKGYVYMDI